MGEFLKKLLDSDFMGHGYCYLWKPEIVVLHATSDSVIALSYYFIPLMLVYLVRKRRDLPFHWMFFMFGVFILGCGTTHLMELWTLWHGTYRLAGLIKAVTAAASMATAIALVPLVPKAMQLPSPAELKAANSRLEKEIAERRIAEQALEVERNFIRAVLNTISTIIVVQDLESRIIQCNAACEHMVGRPTGLLSGRPVEDLFAIADEGREFQLIIEQLQNTPGRAESHWTVDGKVRFISWSVTVLSDGGRPHHIIAAGVDVTESKRLQEEVLNISSREERRIGQDLHDGLGQHLTGIAFLIKVLAQKLAAQANPEAEGASKIVQLVNEAISKTRELARGLLPVGAEASGLISALQQLSSEVEGLFRISCEFNFEDSIRISNQDVGTHLYRIAKEAVNNAIKHGHPTEIGISLRIAGDAMAMTIRDNGVGLLASREGQSPGLGLRIMKYRAEIIGATLQVEGDLEGGTVVTCRLRGGV